MRYSVIYGDTQKSNVLENNDVEDVAISREQQNVSVPMPQLEQANQALVAKLARRSTHRTSSTLRWHS
ncbi:Penicillin-binding protein 1A [Escherichia coli]|uniref:Penicillin-binding protein 1A n=1 Tax=Escherichia coli TaxID=562 RepID=A0A377AC64_ECOLX|nr:Penicillin-binding protein 1A [Escherichia coli]